MCLWNKSIVVCIYACHFRVNLEPNVQLQLRSLLQQQQASPSEEFTEVGRHCGKREVTVRISFRRANDSAMFQDYGEYLPISRNFLQD